MGAALQGGIKSGEVKDMVLIDVTSLTVGLNSRGQMVSLIERGSPMPTRKSKVFTTAEDNQNSVHVEVFQGERPQVAQNKKLGQFELSGILPAPAGVPQIEVTFDIDVNGLLTVSAKDLASGTEQKVTVSGASGLDDASVARAVREAEENAEADAKFKEQISTRNRAESLVNQSDALIKDYGSRVSEELKNEVVTATQKTRDALKSEDFEAISKASDELFSAQGKFGSAIYGSTGSNN